MLQSETKQTTDFETEAALAQAMDKRGYGKSGGLFPFYGYLELTNYPGTEVSKISFFTEGRVISGFITGISDSPMDDNLISFFRNMFLGKTKE